MSEILLSIIVPVFKVEQYIDRCVESLFQVALPEIEYIFVDDCTPDQSMEHVHAKAKMFQIPDPRITFLKNDKNSGLSVTRNHGTAVAKGRYIWFVDSDDWIADGVLPKLLAFLKQNLPEILALNAVQTNGTDHSVEYTPYLKNYSGIFEGKKLLPHASPCAQLYIFDHIYWKSHGFSFYPGIYHEDLELTPKTRYLANRVMVFPETVYYYRITEGSIVAVPKLKRSMDLLLVAQRLTDFMKENVAEQNQSLFADTIAITLTSSLNNVIRLEHEEKKMFLRELGNRRHLFSVCRICSRFKHRLLSLFQILPVSLLMILYPIYFKVKEY